MILYLVFIFHIFFYILLSFGYTIYCLKHVVAIIWASSTTLSSLYPQFLLGLLLAYNFILVGLPRTSTRASSTTLSSLQLPINFPQACFILIGFPRTFRSSSSLTSLEFFLFKLKQVFSHHFSTSGRWFSHLELSLNEFFLQKESWEKASWFSSHSLVLFSYFRLFKFTSVFSVKTVGTPAPATRTWGGFSIGDQISSSCHFRMDILSKFLDWDLKRS